MYLTIKSEPITAHHASVLQALEAAWSAANPRELDDLAQDIAAHAEEFAGLCAEVSTLSTLRKLSADAPLSAVERARLDLLAVSRCRWVADQAREIAALDDQEATITDEGKES